MLMFLPSSVTFTKNKGRVNYIKSKLHQSSRLIFEAQLLLFNLLQLEVVFCLCPHCSALSPYQCRQTCMTNSMLRCMDGFLKKKKDQRKQASLVIVTGLALTARISNQML